MEATRPIGNDTILFREVRAENLEEEINLINNTVTNFPYVAMATDPGVISEPVGFGPDLVYDFIKMNVDDILLIQLGLTLFNAQGQLPTCGTQKYCIWQFNFDKIDMDLNDKPTPWLLKNIGVGYQKDKAIAVETTNPKGEAINVEKFIELFVTSGVVKNPRVQNITCQGGFHYGYLIRTLSGHELPEARKDFLVQVQEYFPNVYDVMYMVQSLCFVHGYVEDIAKRLEVKRVGPPDEIGSESLLIALTFNALRKKHFPGDFEALVHFKDALADLVDSNSSGLQSVEKKEDTLESN